MNIHGGSVTCAHYIVNGVGMQAKLSNAMEDASYCGWNCLREKYLWDIYDVCVSDESV